ncbi:sigma-70 family RNA polymerase sigma factor [Flavobacteriaceae bacterium]|nr:sigma-70 family RNA polymerase sigma factor [Flavobacteriaceae bacterium]
MNQPNKQINHLVEACINQESWAQMKLYDLYYKAMYNTAYRILKNQMEAEDIMQEAFLTAFAKINQFSKSVSFGAWLKKIVVNKSLTQLKKRQNQLLHFELDEGRIPDTLDGHSEHHWEDITLKVEAVHEALNSLKENYRIVLSLNLIEGYQLEEIAQIMNISYGNARVIVSRAKSKLKDALLVNHE